MALGMRRGTHLSPAQGAQTQLGLTRGDGYDPLSGADLQGCQEWQGLRKTKADVREVRRRETSAWLAASYADTLGEHTVLVGSECGFSSPSSYSLIPKCLRDVANQRRVLDRSSLMAGCSVWTRTAQATTSGP